MIRLAQHADIVEITKFAKKYKEEKELFTDSEFVDADFKQFLFGCISDPKTKVFISKYNKEVRGFIVITVDRCPWNKKDKWASDVLFAAKADGFALLNTAIRWAKALKCWKIYFSNSTGQEQADKFLSAYKDLKQVGGHYEFCG